MNAPKLRFKEFNDEYKKVKLNTQCEFLNGLTYALNDIADEGITVLRSSNIQNSRIDYSDIVKVNINVTSKLKINENDILICVRNGSKNLVGKTAWLSKKEENCTWGAFMNVIRPNTSNKYIYYFLNGYSFHNHIWKDLGTATVNQITKKTLDDCYINIPSIKEQNKISDFFSLLDKKIELQSKKIEDLKLFKKGLLIKEFNNKKCSNKLKECFDFGKAGGTPKSTNKDYYNGYIPFLSISDMTTQGKYIYYTDKSITEAGLNNSTAWLVPKNSIIISMYASYGLVSINKIDLTTSQAMFNMVINKNYVVEYIYYYLYYLYISSFYNSIVSTGTQSNLNAEQIKLLDIYIPCYKEQKRIYEQFSKIDFKINLEQIKFNELLYLKKGLMQNMFV